MGEYGLVIYPHSPTTIREIMNGYELSTKIENVKNFYTVNFTFSHTPDSSTVKNIFNNLSKEMGEYFFTLIPKNEYENFKSKFPESQFISVYPDINYDNWRRYALKLAHKWGFSTAWLWDNDVESAGVIIFDDYRQPQLIQGTSEFQLLWHVFDEACFSDPSILLGDIWTGRYSWAKRRLMVPKYTTRYKLGVNKWITNSKVVGYNVLSLSDLDITFNLSRNTPRNTAFHLWCLQNGGSVATIPSFFHQKPTLSRAPSYREYEQSELEFLALMEAVGPNPEIIQVTSRYVDGAPRTHSIDLKLYNKLLKVEEAVRCW
jgi:hypothetical protein